MNVETHMFMGRKTQHSEDVGSASWMYRSNAMLIIILAWLFVEIDELILNFIQKGKDPRIAEKA